MSEDSVTPSSSGNILRLLPPDQAFRFYRGVDVPLDVSAKSLEEFLQCVRRVEPASIIFHLDCMDFENWVRMIGDNTLADTMAA